MVENVLGFHQQRFVVVRADAVGFADLSEVHGRILVAQNRLGYFLGGAREFGERFGDCVEMLHRGERYGDAGHSSDARRPYSGG